MILYMLNLYHKYSQNGVKALFLRALKTNDKFKNNMGMKNFRMYTLYTPASILRIK